MSYTRRRWGLGGLSVLLVGALLLALSACSDDPVLGPPDESRDTGGGSYSAIERLAPADSATAVPDSASSPSSEPSNPSRF